MSKLDPVGKSDADIDNDGDVDSSDKYLKMRRKAIGKAIKNVKESLDLDEAVDFSNHMKNPYHKILDAHDYKHVKSQVVDQGIARHSPYTAHTYNRDGGHIAQVWSYHNGNKPVWHARYKQDNGIMAPAFGETKPSLSKYLERRFGSTNE